jgi:hypothetical protein
MAVPKTAALPLGDTPSLNVLTIKARNINYANDFPDLTQASFLLFSLKKKRVIKT